MVKRTADIIGRNRILGVVLNQADASEQSRLRRLLRRLLPARQRQTGTGHDASCSPASHDALAHADRVRDGADRGGGRRGRVSSSRRQTPGKLLALEDGLSKALLIAGVAQVCLYYADLYDLRLLSDRRELFIRILNALASASLILAAVYYWLPALVIGRGVFMIAAVFVITLVIGWRIAFEWASRHVRPRERLLLVGTNAGRGRSGARDVRAPA